MTHDDCEWRDAFLDSLRVTGNVSAAARLVGRSRASLYRMRRIDPDFASAWQDALEEAVDWLELEALRRAVEGIKEDRFSKGEIVGTITRYSDSLLMFLLKARRPWLYDRRVLRGGQTNTDEDSFDASRAALEEKLDRLANLSAKD
ncbi:hypothetical protein [Candidatus Puniceispirillum sp.]|uniref:hypothetical protein n=1 Tax=Candidatus Puniceispirillum sp. TaxID=2026719 RepID=UPI003F69D7F0